MRKYPAEIFGYDIEDFILIEFQTAQTTGTGQLIKSLEDFIKGKDIAKENYPFGLNMADIWKRTFTQILNKGITLEKWGNKIYWAVQEPVWKNFVDRYNLKSLDYDVQDKSVFMVYDIKKESGKYELRKTRTESSSIENLFDAFKSSANVPSKDYFVEKLEINLRKNSGCELNEPT